MDNLPTKGWVRSGSSALWEGWMVIRDRTQSEKQFIHSSNTVIRIPLYEIAGEQHIFSYFAK